jgi:hypothetical protein
MFWVRAQNQEEESKIRNCRDQPERYQCGCTGQEQMDLTPRSYFSMAEGLSSVTYKLTIKNVGCSARKQVV